MTLKFDKYIFVLVHSFDNIHFVFDNITSLIIFFECICCKVILLPKNKTQYKLIKKNKILSIIHFYIRTKNCIKY